MELTVYNKRFCLLILFFNKALLRINRIIGLLITVCLFCQGTSFAQEITLSIKNVSLIEAFSQIEKQTDYHFVFVKEQLSQAGLVTIDVKKAALQTALQQCFYGQPLSYVIEDRLIIVSKKNETKSQPVLHEVKGRVSNTDGAPLVGITIEVKGGAAATFTDENGEFTLNGISTMDVLVVSGAEMETKEIRINSAAFLSIVLRQKIHDLDEAIIVGYGTTTRRYSVGSVTKVTASEIGQQPVANPLAALQGRVPGLVVVNTSGVPGATVNIQVRGQNSLNPNPALNSGIPPLDNPLIIIDGVIFAPQNSPVNQFNSIASPGSSEIYSNVYGGMSPLSNLNPGDIESMEVLRDANETAIYGSRGANGVILITTKKGKVGKTTFNLDVQSGVSMISHTMPMMNTPEYLDMRYEALSNDGLLPNMIPSSPAYAPDLLRFDTTRSTDWKDFFLGGVVNTTDVNGGISGGSENTQFLVSAGYHKEGYIFPGNFKNERGSFNSNLQHFSSNRKLSFSLSFNYSYNKNNSIASPNALKAFTLAPDYPELTDGDNLVWMYNGVILFDNPLAYLKQQYVNGNSNLLGNMVIGYQVLKGLTAKISVGYNTFNGREHSTLPKSSQHPLFNPVSYASFGNNDYTSFSIEPVAEYNRAVGHGQLLLLVGGTYQYNSAFFQQTNGSNYSDDALLNSINGAGSVHASDGFNEYKYLGVFGRANYVLDRKYILNFNGRRDGSSRFGPGRQFGNFGALGAGWIFSEEDFVKKAIPELSFGKIRVSWGTTGNDNIGDYEYLTKWAPSGLLGLSFQGQNGYLPQNLSNPDFSWSVTKKAEVGIELGWLKDRILLNATWYRHRSSNQLVTYQLPSQTGFTGVTANFPATVQNTGWEIFLSASIIKKEHFSWNSAFNLTIPRNKLLEFDDLENSSYANTYVLGQSLTTLNKFIWEGVDEATGIYQYQSKNGLTSNPEAIVDYHVIGNLDPKYFGGVSNTLVYKNISLDLFLEFKKQIGPSYLQQVYFNGAVGGYGNVPLAINEHWRKPGDDASIQRLTAYSFGATEASLAAINYAYSSAAFIDASYIRFKTIALSYALPQKFIKKAGLQTCRVYVNAQNVFTITNYKGHDPEIMSFYSVPPLKTFVAGIHFTL